MSSSNLLSVLNKERFIFFSSLLVGLCLAGMYYFFFYTQVYTTGAELFVRNVTNNSVVADYKSSNSRLSSESGYSNPLFNLKSLIESDRVARSIYKDLYVTSPKGLRLLGITNEASWLKAYPSLITASIKPSTDVLSVKFSWPDEAKADKVLGLVIKEFRSLNVELSRYIETKRRENLEGELNSITKKIDTLHGQIADFETDNQAANFEGELVGLTQSRVSLEQQAKLIKSKISNQANKVEVLRSQLNLKNAKQGLKAISIGRDPFLQKLNSELADAQIKYAALKAKYTDKHPEVIGLSQEMQALKNNITRRTQETVGESGKPNATANLAGRQNVIYDEASQALATDLARAEADLNALQGEEISLLTSIATMKTQENKVPFLKKNWQALQKAEPSLLEAYQSTQQKYLEAVINERDVVDNIVPLGEPSAPESTRKPLLIKLFAIVALSALLGAAIAWIKNGVEDQWTGTQEMEALTNCPVLGVIPWFKEKVSLMGYQEKQMLRLSYHHTALQLISRISKFNHKVISIRGTEASQQGNHMLPPLAHALSAIGYATCVIRTNVLHPDEKNPLGPNYVGAVYDMDSLLRFAHEVIESQYASKRQEDYSFEHSVELIQQFMLPMVQNHSPQEVFNFYFEGATEADISKRLGTRAFVHVVEAIKRQFDVVLLDTPNRPMAFPEVTNILQTADATLVLAGHQHNRNQLLETIRMLQEKYDTQVVGLVIRQMQTEFDTLLLENKDNAAPYEKYLTTAS